MRIEPFTSKEYKARYRRHEKATRVEFIDDAEDPRWRKELSLIMPNLDWDASRLWSDPSSKGSCYVYAFGWYFAPDLVKSKWWPKGVVRSMHIKSILAALKLYDIIPSDDGDRVIIYDANGYVTHALRQTLGGWTGKLGHTSHFLTTAGIRDWLGGCWGPNFVRTT